MRRSIFCLILAKGIAVHAQSTRIYLAPDDHTDFTWSGTPAQYEQWIPQMIDYYLDLNDNTSGNAPHLQHRWNCDGSYWVDIYKRNRSTTQFNRLITQLQSGRMTIPLNTLVVTYGGNTTEGVIRGGYYAGRLQRQHGLNIPIAISMENQTMPLGLASLWKGMGANYSWKGVCGCASQVSGLSDRNHEIYQYTGLDGQSVMMKWYSLTWNQSLGGYAEAWSPSTGISQCLNKISSDPSYPYTVAGAFGRGWDNTLTTTNDFIPACQAGTSGNTLCRVSNMVDFFQDFEATYPNLPSESLSYGNEWDLDCASISEVTGDMRRHIERLRGAEAMATLAARNAPAVWTGLDSLRERAMLAIGLYWEHNFGGGGVMDGAALADWHRELEATTDLYLSTLLTNARNALGAQIPSGGEQRFFVLNPLGQARTDIADIPYSGALPVRVIDRVTSLAVPSQVITRNGQQYIRILATNVPSAGYKVFTIQSGTPPGGGNTATLNGGVFESTRWRLVVTGNGVITSLQDKLNGNQEHVSAVSGRYANDLGAGNASGGTLVLENNGPVSTTLRCTGTNPIAHTVAITLFTGIERIDIEDRITANFATAQYWDFCLNVPGPTVRHEELGAILTAKLSSSGGHYSPTQARYDHQSLGHFVDMSNATRGLTIGSLGPAFFKLGSSTVTTFDQNSQRIRICAGGNFAGSGPGIFGQDGDTQFSCAFSLHPHEGAFDQTTAMQRTMQAQNAFEVGACTGATTQYPADQFSALSVNDADAQLWALKPAEEGIAQGIIARLWNTATTTQSITLSSGWSWQAAQAATHIETNTGALVVNGGTLTTSLAGNRMRTLRLTPGSPGVQLAAKALLEGPYNSGTQLLSDGLRTAGLLPATEPYTALGFTQVSGGGGETCSSSVFATTGNNAIVDWVLLELRDVTTPSQILATRCALLQRDGDIVATDGLSPVTIMAPAGSYHVAIRHRNHLGIMSSAPIALSASSTALDLSQASTATYGVDGRKPAGTRSLMWAGNVVRDDLLKYVGASNDRDPILVRVGGTTPNNTAPGYWSEDINLDGLVKYTGSGNDRDPILVNIGGSSPNNTRLEQLP